MKYLVLGITGKRGCGKDTVARYLRDNHGFKVLIYTDDVLAPMLKAQGRQVTRDNLIKLATELRRMHGVKVLTEMISERITYKDIWCISGVRFPEEVEFLKGFYGDVFLLLKVECDEEKRYERVKTRGTKGESDMTIEEFRKTDKKATEKVIDKTMKMANLSLDNNGTKEELYRQIDDMMKEMKGD